jgi:hypothetical protein
MTLLGNKLHAYLTTDSLRNLRDCKSVEQYLLPSSLLL